MSFRFPIALALSIICLVTPAWADFQAGLDAYERGNYATTVKEWRPLAEQGDPTAQHHLWLYVLGHGVPQDYEEAVRWFLKAAGQVNTNAQTKQVSQSSGRSRYWHI